MEIGRLKVGYTPHPLPVGDRDVALFALDHALITQGLQHPIDVNGCETRRIGEMLLRHRENEAFRRPQARRLAADSEFAQHMCDAALCIAATDIQHPFAKDRGVDQRVVPQRFADRRAGSPAWSCADFTMIALRLGALSKRRRQAVPEQGDQPNASEGADPSADIREQNPGAATTADLADQPPEAGKRPPHAPTRSGVGEVGTGDGYSGQEYDSRGQGAWRDEQEKEAVDPSGEVHGSGAGAGGGNEGEDYDNDSAAGDGPVRTGAGSRN